jgi:DNA-binding NtrC family response regulator
VKPHNPETVDASGGGRRAGAPIALKLSVVAGPDEGRELPLDGLAVVGSDAACTLVLHDRSVSRRHVEIAVNAGRVRVKDLGSRNGTFFGGARIGEGEVPVGAVLGIGDSQVAVQPRWQTREVPPSKERRFGELYAESIAMREIFGILERVAPTDVTVLVEGESGTGKELVARSLHAASSRARAPYVVVDCAAVPAALAESELFGHKKGAFSGATQDRAGAFQRANGGTVCLDEMGELPLDLQPKLLRVLETGEVRAVGDDVVRKVDVRLIAATNRDLHAEVKRGAFRGDLLYRLEVVKVRIPPLRQRPEDIPILIERLLDGKLPPGGTISGENLTRLMAYSWPGNVRELRNVLARAIALAGPNPTFERLVFNLGPAAETPATIGTEYPGITRHLPFKEAKAQLLASFERAYVSALLERHQGNVRRAAEAAGLSRKHVYTLMEELGIGGDDGAERSDD